MGRGGRGVGHGHGQDERLMQEDDLSNVLKVLIEKHYLTYGIFWSEGDGICSFRSCYIDNMMVESLASQGKSSFVEQSVDVQFPPGQGTVGRVMRSQAYEWIPNIQALSSVSFNRLAAAKDSRIKTVITVAVPGGVVEVGSLMVLREDRELVQDIKTTLRNGVARGGPSALRAAK